MWYTVLRILSKCFSTTLVSCTKCVALMEHYGSLNIWCVHKDFIMTVCSSVMLSALCMKTDLVNDTLWLENMVSNKLWRTTKGQVNSARPDGVWRTEEFCLWRTEDSLASAVPHQPTVAASVVMSDRADPDPPPTPPPASPPQPLSAPITVHMATTSHGGWLTCTSPCACHSRARLILAPGETEFDLKDKKTNTRTEFSNNNLSVNCLKEEKSRSCTLFLCSSCSTFPMWCVNPVYHGEWCAYILHV